MPLSKFHRNKQGSASNAVSSLLYCTPRLQPDSREVPMSLLLLRVPRRIPLMHQHTQSIPSIPFCAVNPVHYHDQLKRSSYAVLWCVFAVFTVCQIYDSGLVWSSFWKNAAWGAAKSYPAVEREGLSAAGSALHTLLSIWHFTPRHCKSIALHYCRKQHGATLFCFCIWYIYVVVHLCCLLHGSWNCGFVEEIWVLLVDKEWMVGDNTN